MQKATTTKRADRGATSLSVGVGPFSREIHRNVANLVLLGAQGSRAMTAITWFDVFVLSCKKSGSEVV